MTLITPFLQVVPLLGVRWPGWFRIDPICNRSDATCGRSGLPKLGLLLQIQSSYNPLMGIICVYFKKKLEYRYEKG